MSDHAHLTDLTIADARDKMAKGDFTARELTDAHIVEMDAADKLNAYVTKTADKARDMADAADARIKAGTQADMTGIPLAIKDLYCTKNVKTTAGSKMLECFIPPYESTVTQNLFDDGAVMLGKANMDEFAMGSANETSFYGNVINPWKASGAGDMGSDVDLVPGGSSGGSVAAVAARTAMAATGSDTGGSIRQPAAFTGLVGVKPTYGRCSRFGMVAFASSLDQAGPITKTVRDAAIMLKSMASYDPQDSTSVDCPVPNYEAALGGDLKGKRIGIPKEYHIDGMPEEIEKLWKQGIDWLTAAGAEIVDISLPHTKYALPAYYIVAPAECSSNLARYDGVRYGLRNAPQGGGLDDLYEATRAEGFGAEVQRRILIGTYVLSAGYYDAYYLQAQKVRSKIKQDFDSAFEKVDAILTPSTPSAAFPIGDESKKADPVAMYLNDVFTVTANMAGLPGMSIPAGLDANGLPLGLQILAPAFGEEAMLQIGGIIEESASFTLSPKTWWKG